NFLRRTAHCFLDHLFVHSDQNLVVLDSVANLGRQSLHVSLGGRLGAEIKHGIKEFLELLEVHLGNVLWEDEREIRSLGIQLFGIDGSAGASTHTRNLYALIPLYFLLRTAIDLKANVMVLDLNAGDLYPLAGTRGDTLVGDHHGEILSIGLYLSRWID